MRIDFSINLVELAAIFSKIIVPLGKPLDSSVLSSELLKARGLPLYLFIYHLVRVTYFSKDCTILLIGSFSVEKPTVTILRDENSLSQISAN